MKLMNQARITFLGAAQTVTGSCTLIEYHKAKIMIDCGLFQGPKEVRQRNWDMISPSLAQSIQAVILTHAHVDHSGLLPKLFQLGFRGSIYCTASTLDLCRILLPDSAYLQEEDARRMAGRGNQNFFGPLYSVEDAEGCLNLFNEVSRRQWFELAPGLSFQFYRAGHILGSSIVQLALSAGNGVRLLTFSGDLGNDRQFLIKGPEEISETDDLILEATYGDRNHSLEPPEQQLEAVIHEVQGTGGVLVIPAFAVGRTQELLYLIKKLEEQKKIPRLPVYLDSPMALDATELYLQGADDLKPEWQDGELIPPLSPENFLGVPRMEDSMALMSRPGPMIIISAAGMLTGGRILYHLKERLPDPKNRVLFVGYQAEETKGRLLQEGLRTIRIHKENILVRAKIESMQSLSAHADSDQLLSWVQKMEKKPKRVFLNHGEKSGLRALAYRLQNELSLEVIIPEPQQSFTIPL